MGGWIGVKTNPILTSLRDLMRMLMYVVMYRGDSNIYWPGFKITRLGVVEVYAQ